jgi:anti-sigma B factor antagonist
METFETKTVASRPGGITLPSAFSCTSLEQGTSTVVVAVGDVDLAASPRLWRALSDALSVSASVIVDCTLITFCDSAGLQALMRAHHAARDTGAFFALASTPDCLNRVMRLAGFSGMLRTFATVAAARDGQDDRSDDSQADQPAQDEHQPIDVRRRTAPGSTAHHVGLRG